MSKGDTKEQTGKSQGTQEFSLPILTVFNRLLLKNFYLFLATVQAAKVVMYNSKAKR